MAKIEETELDPAGIRERWSDYRDFCISISSVERWTALGMDYHLVSFVNIMKGFGHQTLHTREVLEALVHMD